MVQMTVSDQIIAVLNDLCAKFGLAIDWSSENVIPYLQDICTRFVRCEAFLSILWCFIGILPAVILLVMWKFFEKRAAEELKIQSYSSYKESSVFAQVLFWILLFIEIIVVSVNVSYLIKCVTVPEMVIFEYISDLLKSGS